MPNQQRSILAAVTLFILAPFVAEYLLGDLPITYLPLLIVLAPMYGGGALLIRELTRRFGRGWPTILLLGCAYCLLEEGVTTQSLFNRNFLGLHLLEHAWIPALGISGWWTLFMLNVHPFWSIGVSIALVEGLFPSRARTPWLGKIGESIAAALFLIGVCFNTAYSIRQYHFIASHAQFTVIGVLCILFVIAAFLLPRSIPRTEIGDAPPPWLAASATFLLGFAVFLAPLQLNWGAVAWIFGADLLFLFFLWSCSRHASWTALHTFSIGAAGALVYGVHAFMQGPVVPARKGMILASHVLFLVLAIILIAAATRRIQRALAGASNPEIAVET
jgi:hypothetical protein